MGQYKLHLIARSNSVNPIVGITIPSDVSQFFSGCYFKIEIKKIGSTYGIYCISGCLNVPTTEQIKNYKFEDCKI